MVVDDETGEADALAAFSVGGEDGMDVAGENEFVWGCFDFWMMREDKILFFKIIDVHFQIGFQEHADGQNVVVTNNDQHFNVMMCDAPSFEKLPFGVVLSMKKIAEENNAAGACVFYKLV